MSLATNVVTVSHCSKLFQFRRTSSPSSHLLRFFFRWTQIFFLYYCQTRFCRQKIFHLSLTFASRQSKENGINGVVTETKECSLHSIFSGYFTSEINTQTLAFPGEGLGAASITKIIFTILDAFIYKLIYWLLGAGLVFFHSSLSGNHVQKILPK